MSTPPPQVFPPGAMTGPDHALPGIEDHSQFLQSSSNTWNMPTYNDFDAMQQCSVPENGLGLSASTSAAPSFNFMSFDFNDNTLDDGV